METRYLTGALEDAAWKNRKMAFVSGPRQAGKTTLAKLLLRARRGGRYFNWDDVEFRRIWVKSPKTTIDFPSGERATNGPPLIVFDEIHKAKGWKGTLKGLFDTAVHPVDILVTGSARLNIYKKGSDSLLGRYFHFRLHPFSVGELTSNRLLTPTQWMDTLTKDSESSVDREEEVMALLLKYGGFPEPFLRQSIRFARLWRRGRIEKIVREDLRDLSRIPELSQVEMLVALLPERAGGLLSVQSLREDLEVAHRTVERWLSYLNELYYLFALRPYTRSISRSLRKERKLYLWDWTEVPSSGARFENFVASHLLKACHYWTDSGEGNFSLSYLRDKEKREIDFLITCEGKPWLAIECKCADTSLSPGFAAFLPRLGNPPFLQLVESSSVKKNVQIGKSQGWIRSAAHVLGTLP